MTPVKKIFNFKRPREKRKRLREQNIQGVPTHNEKKNAPVDNYDIHNSGLRTCL